MAGVRTHGGRTVCLVSGRPSQLLLVPECRPVVVNDTPGARGTDAIAAWRAS